jgi:hypothetical protein
MEKISKVYPSPIAVSGGHFKTLKHRVTVYQTAHSAVQKNRSTMISRPHDIEPPFPLKSLLMLAGGVA